MKQTNGPWRVHEPVGRGRYGVVYRGESLDNGEIVSLKRGVEGWPGLEDQQARCAQLAGFGVSGVDTPYAWIRHDGEHWALMSWTADTSLASLRRHPMPSKAMAEVITQVAGQLLALRSAGYAGAFDLQPEHVRVDSAGGVRLVDLWQGQPDTRDVDCALWLSPEQLADRPNQAAEVYTLGLLAMSMLLGELPQQPETHMGRHGVQLSMSLDDLMAAGVGEPTAAMLSDLLAFRESDRPSLTEAAEWMAELASDLRSDDLATWAAKTVPLIQDVLSTDARSGGLIGGSGSEVVWVDRPPQAPQPLPEVPVASPEAQAETTKTPEPPPTVIDSRPVSTPDPDTFEAAIETEEFEAVVEPDEQQQTTTEPEAAAEPISEPSEPVPEFDPLLVETARPPPPRVQSQPSPEPISFPEPVRAAPERPRPVAMSSGPTGGNASLALAIALGAALALCALWFFWPAHAAEPSASSSPDAQSVAVSVKPAPRAPPPATQVTMAGAEVIWLVQGELRFALPGPIKGGIYQVEATFESDPVDAGQLEIPDAGAVTVQCDAQTQRCAILSD